jgi:putative beta-lysine N-acetyltransferase
MKLSMSDADSIVTYLDELVSAGGYSKIFTRIPSSLKASFLTEGYVEEACIPHFFKGRESASFMSKFLRNSRKIDLHSEENKNVLKAALLKHGVMKEVKGDYEFDSGICTVYDVGTMVDIYQSVFETYPFPIHDPDFILKSMRENVVYFCIKVNGKIVALSSCETDYENRSVEMTDFATLSECTNKGYSSHLLGLMESKMCEMGFKTAYTIARASSYGINTIFSRYGYEYAGSLVNNTNISGSIESMNVWYKHLC